jgi:hypothetical protein
VVAQGTDAWTGENKRWPAVSQSGALLRRQRHQGSRAGEGRGARREKGDELNQGLFCNFREKQGLDCKGLTTFKPVLK